jgi:hypothetical protein
MAVNPPRITLTEPQRLWLRVICSKLRSGEQVSARPLKVELRDKLPRDFDPAEIDYRLLANEDRITLLGIALLDPTSELVKKADLVISSIHHLLIHIPEAKSIGADVISQETKLPKEEVAVIFSKLSRVGYFHDSGTTYGYGIDGLLTINIDSRTFDAYLKYKSLKDILGTLIDNENNVVNRAMEEGAQKALQDIRNLSLHTPADKENLTHANYLYDSVKNLIQNSEALDESEARIIVESAEDAINEFGSTNQEKKVKLRKWKYQAELVLPPGTIEELRKRAEGNLLKRSWPRSVLLQRALLGIVALVLIGGTFLYLKKTFSANDDANKVSPMLNPLPSPLITSTPVPKQSRDVALSDAQLNSSNAEAQMPPLCIRYEESKSALGGDLTIGMGGISYEGSPLRHFVSFTVNSPGQEAVKYSHKENGDKITYKARGPFEITLLSTDTFSACFDVRRTTQR